MMMQASHVGSPQHLADDAVREVLLAQWLKRSAIVVQSPPGGGKTGIVERVAMQEMLLLHGRAMLVTQTNEQAFDLARRLARRYSTYQIHLLVRRDLSLPADLTTMSNLQILRAPADIPGGPCLVIANAAKWSWTEEADYQRFTCMVVDEAYQLADYRFQQIAGLADRLVLVGDPGQIAPVITCDIDRWRSDPAGPHVACPEALLRRHPALPQVVLPVSRRLVADTVALIQPAFYPMLPFIALSQPGTRRLLSAIGGIRSPFDRAINLAQQGASIVQIELAPLMTGENDEEIADAIVALVERLLGRRVQFTDDSGGPVPLTSSMVGVVCAHVSQVGAVVKRLPAGWEVLVETADRFQGLERPVMLVHHPLSGRIDADTFHTDAGRLCVMLSRHRVACFVVTRGGLDGVLLRNPPAGDRILGIEDDRAYAGWLAHLRLVQALQQRGRIVAV